MFESWAVDRRDRDPAAYGETLDRWAAYLDRLGATAVLEGALILHRRTGGRKWFRADKIPPGRPEPAAQHVERVFRNRSFLSDVGDEALLEQTLRLVEHTRVEQELHCREGGYVVDSMTLALDEGLGFRAGMDQRPALGPFLDGTRSLEEAIAAAVHALGLALPDVDTFTAAQSPSFGR